MTGAGIAAQFTSLVSQYGIPVLMNRGGSTQTIDALFEPANAVVIATYFDDNAAVGLVRPCLQMFVDATASGTNNPPQINDTFSLDGRSYTVQKVQNHRIGSSIVLITCLVD